MTTPLFTADGSLLPLLAGALALLFATVKAVMQRGNLRGLILWGALHDAGVACMALAAQNPAGQTGFWLFLLFQIAARLLALTALARLAPSGQATHVDELRGAGRRHPWPGAFFCPWPGWQPWAARLSCCPRRARSSSRACLKPLRQEA